MENKWTEICSALKELLQILSCSKCEKSLCDNEQFLMCGHFTCKSCLNENILICKKCQDTSKNKTILKDDLIKKIANVCDIIAGAIRFNQNDENIEIQKQDIQILKKVNNDTITTNTSSHFILSNSSINLNQVQCCSKKVRKRKNSAWKRNKKSKIPKCNNGSLILSNPKNIDKKNHHGETKLQRECRKGHKENVKRLLETGADPNVCCNANWTPLQESVDFEYYEITKMLLDAGASVDQRGYKDRTPLHQAVKNGNFKLVTLLLQYKADKSITDIKGKKPIDYCQLNEIKKLLDCCNENQMQYNNEEVNQNHIIYESNANCLINSPEEFKFNIIPQINSEETGNIDNNLLIISVNNKNIEIEKKFNYDLEKVLNKNILEREVDRKLQTCITNVDQILKINLMNIYNHDLQAKINSVKEKENSNEISNSQEIIDVESNQNSKDITYMFERFQDMTSIIDYKSNHRISFDKDKYYINIDSEKNIQNYIGIESKKVQDCIFIDSDENVEDYIYIDSEEIVDIIN